MKQSLLLISLLGVLSTAKDFDPLRVEDFVSENFT